MRQFIIKFILQIKNATYYSLSGLKTALQEEFAFRLEVLIFIIAFPAAFFWGNTSIERAVLISTLFLIFIAELLNSAIENTLNRIDRNWHPLIKKAKDLGSAAVMMALINALIVWACIIIPHFWSS